MATINLLPWREEQREERKREFYVMLAVSAVFALSLVVTMHLVVSGMIAKQNARNDFLKSEIAQLDTRIQSIKLLKEKKSKFLARMSVIQDLQANRPYIVKFFEQLIALLPDGIHLSTLKHEGHKFMLTGVADSNTSISSLMRNIESSNWVTRPRLTEIKQSKKGSSEQSFILQLEENIPYLHNKQRV